MASKNFFFNMSKNRQGALRLVCFPYAGGGASVFKSWESQLPDWVDLLVAELPGRGLRFTEPFLYSMNDVITQMADDFLNYMDKPFVFFGHSLGALVCFELCKELRARSLATPDVLIISGKKAPNSPVDSQYHLLSDDLLINQLRNYEGTPDAILSDVDMMKLVLPMLRADFSVAETYKYSATPKFDFPIVAFGGKSDKGVSRDGLLKWGEFSEVSFACEMFDGAHFYLQQQDSKDRLLNRIRNILSTIPVLANG